ncbi:DNRLRE domain-containing protein [candidate division WOR-3 bacterium]|nr:DNRLRE domain-containing protein [candidate division WOR-3 bacterium]
MKRAIVLLLALGALSVMVFCEEGELEIEGPTVEDATLAPGESTILHCDVAGASGEVTYAWEASENQETIENMGDSARWTAPDFVWGTTTVTITVTAEDAEGNTGEGSVDIEVQVNGREIAPSEDTYTFSYVPDTSYEGGEFLRVGYDDSWESQDAFFHAWFWFPTPGIPAGETLHGARLRLYREYGEGEEIEIEIYLPRDDWQAEGLTWNNEPDADDFAMISDNTTDVGYFYITLTSLVQDWIDGARDNYGIMLRVLDETDYTHRFRDYGAIEGTQSKRPALEVVSW